VQNGPHVLEELILRFSSLNRLLRSVVHVLLFTRILSSKGSLLPSDLDKAESYLVKVVQQRHFRLELELLNRKQLPPPKLRALAYFCMMD
jgi:hypothetical protein